MDDQPAQPAGEPPAALAGELVLRHNGPVSRDTEFFRLRGWRYLGLVAAGCDPSLVRVDLAIDAGLDVCQAPRRVSVASQCDPRWVGLASRS